MLSTLISLSCAVPPQPAQPPYAAQLDTLMTDALAKRDLPGAALVVVQGDQIAYHRGFGTADLATGRPYTDSTHTVIGSTSKPLTALAVLRLVQLGQVALDTPIVRYAPELAFQDARAATITLRHLLTNRSGLPVGFSGPAYERPSRTGPNELEHLARSMTALPLLFAPGEGYAYSNRGWALAGFLVQRVSQVPIETFMRTEVFEPLGMRETTLEFWKVGDLAQGYVEGRTLRNHPVPASLSQAYGPAGMIVSTPQDMGRLLVAMLNEGRTVLGTQFLTPELIAEALRPQADAESELGGSTRYGLGWEVDANSGTLTVKKAGSVHTMVSLWVILPEQKVAVAFAFNREDYQILPIVPEVLKAIAGGRSEFLPASSPASTPPLPKGVSLAAGAMTRWIGSYDTRFGDLRTFLRGDSLFVEAEGVESALVPTNESTFQVVDDLVANTGKVYQFRPGSGTVTIWSGPDSVGVRIAR